MIRRDDIIKAIDVISNKLTEMILEIADDKEQIKDLLYPEYATLHTCLTHFQAMLLIARICNQFNICIQDFLNTESDKLPIRYLACYILLNEGIKTNNN